MSITKTKKPLNIANKIQKKYKSECVVIAQSFDDNSIEFEASYDNPIQIYIVCLHILNMLYESEDLLEITSLFAAGVFGPQDAKIAQKLKELYGLYKENKRLVDPSKNFPIFH